MIIDRRKFINTTAQLSLATYGFGVLNLLESCSVPRYVAFQREKERLIINRSELQTEKFVLVNDRSLRAPIFVAKDGDGFITLLMLCTHKSCDVKPAGAILHCPCHGSDFDQKGNVLKGPAEEPLLRYETTWDEQSIYILLKS